MLNGTGAPVNWTGPTVDFSLAKMASPLVLSRVTAPGSGPVTLSAGTTMTVPPVAGWMCFGWPSCGIAEVGTCPDELDATWPGNNVEMVPSAGNALVHFSKTLA